MHLLIVSCSPRIKAKSNTDKIVREFAKGYEENGNTTEILYLAQKSEWNNVKEKFYQNTNILFAIPLYIECIPGLMMEFLEELEPKKDNKTKLGFLLQGAFPEASQLRCCEKYLEMLPEKLGCIYNGTLLKGDMFAVSLIEGTMRRELIEPFYDMGKYYAKNNYFDKDVVTEFAKPEYYSKIAVLFNNVSAPFKRSFFDNVAKDVGCKGLLGDKPYQNYVEK